MIIDNYPVKLGAPGQLRFQARRRVQGLLLGRGEDCAGEEVARIYDSSVKRPTSTWEVG